MQCRHLLPLAGLLLSSCSYSYDLRAIVIDDRLAFIVDPRSRNQAACTHGVHVTTASGERATARAAPGDERALVANGVFWWVDLEVGECLNRFPILYGQPMQGKSFPGTNHPAPQVDAKPLRRGVIYEVTTSGDGGYGGGRFRIRADQTIENLPPTDEAANLTAPAAS